MNYATHWLVTRRQLRGILPLTEWIPQRTTDQEIRGSHISRRSITGTTEEANSKLTWHKLLQPEETVKEEEDVEAAVAEDIQEEAEGNGWVPVETPRSKMGRIIVHYVEPLTTRQQWAVT